MRATRRVTATATALLLVAACSAGDDFVSSDRIDPDASQADATQADDGADAAASDATGDVVSTDASPTVLTTIAAATEPVTDSPVDVGPGVFAENGATELAVSVLRLPPGLDGDRGASVAVAIGLANADVVATGSPFEAGGLFSAPITFGDDDLTDDPERLRNSIDELLVAEADVFVGAVPAALIADTTELAASRGVPLVVVNHLDDVGGAGDRLGTRIDLGGSIDLELQAVAAAVVSGEHDGIVVMGSLNDSNTAQMEQLLLEVGADPVLIDATAPPSSELLEAARQQIAEVGERPAVVLVSEPWAVPIIDSLVSSGSEAQVFASDLSLSRDDVGTLGGFASNQLVVVRRVDDLGRPEVEEFAARLADGQADGASTTFAAVSYDAYVLAAIAAVALGSADGATIRQGMIEASRNGEPCGRVSVCLALAADGVDVDYDGLSGPLELDDDGVATAMWFSVDVADPASRVAASSEFVLQRS